MAAAPLFFDNYRNNDVYAEDVPRGMYRSYHPHRYEAVILQFPNDPVGFRRLVLRDFDTIRGIPICTEHTVCRVAQNGLLSDWSMDVTVFRTGTVPPVRWNENNIPPTLPLHPDIQFITPEAQLRYQEEVANIENMNLNQDILSRLP